MRELCRYNTRQIHKFDIFKNREYVYFSLISCVDVTYFGGSLAFHTDDIKRFQSVNNIEVYTHFFFFTATRETSFVHAISAAGVMHTLTKNCSMGDFENCGCDDSRIGQTGIYIFFIPQK